jgi:hypothetical protein
MIECRHCRQTLRQSLEQMGARCPHCRMPLYEKDRQRPPVVDLGPCATHKDNSAAAKCQRCSRMMCAACRTRWGDEIICVECLDQALAMGDAASGVIRAQDRLAGRSVFLAAVGWAMLLLTIWPLSSLFRGQPDAALANSALLLFFGSFVFALFALGQAATCIRTRGRRLKVAVCGLSMAGLHLGICLGLVALNLWYH